MLNQSKRDHRTMSKGLRLLAACAVCLGLIVAVVLLVEKFL